MTKGLIGCEGKDGARVMVYAMESVRNDMGHEDQKEAAPADASQALAAACLSGNEPSARAALGQGADPNYPHASSCGRGWSVGGEFPRPLHMAMRRGDGGMCQLLIDSGADISLPSLDGKPTVAWLSMGLSSCVAIWMRAGGDPWEAQSCPGEHDLVSLAMIAACGGSEELWALMAALPAHGWAKGLSPAKGVPSLAEVAAKAIQYDNEHALRALAFMGWAPTGKDVIACHAHWGLGPRMEARGHKMALALRGLGAPTPSKADASSIARFHGQPSCDRLLGEILVRFAAWDAKQIAKAAKPSRSGANKEKRKPRL
jgi:hypothetical protein